MAIEDALVSILEDDAAVSALIADRVYPGHLPDNRVYPSVVYQLVSSYPVARTQEGRSGLMSPLYQVDIWAEGYTAARNTAQAVFAALDTYRGTVDGMVIVDVIRENENEGYEEEPGLFRVTQEYRIWHREA